MAPSCPRCGYDLSGIVESWTEACPLTGTCSECGLTFDWADVTRPERILVPGFFEHVTPVSFRAAWRTLLWACWPHRFWSRVRLEHQVRVGRLVLWLVLLLAPFQILHAVSVLGVRLWRELNYTPVPSPAREWGGVVPECLQPILAVDWRVTLVRLTQPAATGGVFAGTIPGWRQWPLVGAGLACVSLALPGMLLCLPQTRSRAKVRLIHVARATIYGMGWLVILALLRLINEIYLWWDRSTFGALRASPWGWVIRHQTAIGLVIGVWLAWWWWHALRRGFRITQTLAVWLSMVVTSALITLTVLSVLSPLGAGNFVDSVLQWRHLP